MKKGFALLAILVVSVFGFACAKEETNIDATMTDTSATMATDTSMTMSTDTMATGTTGTMSTDTMGTGMMGTDTSMTTSTSATTGTP